MAQCTWGKKEIFDDNAELTKYLHYVQFVKQVCASMSFDSLSTSFCFSSADLRNALLPCVTKETLRVESLVSYIFLAFSVNSTMSVSVVCN